MSFDFSTLITDRKQSDVEYARALIGRITNGTATAEELAEWNAATLKGVYDYTDLNRVTAAMDEINSLLSAEGYQTGYDPVRVIKSKLPKDYVELEYIESTGTQYIDTGFQPNSNTVFIVDLLSKNTNCHVFGARTLYRNKAFCLFWASKNDLAVQMSNSTFNGGSFDTSARNLVTMSSSRLKINDVVTSNYSVDYFECEKTAWLMSCYSSSASEYCSGKLYSAKIYDGDKIIRDYVPCKNPDGKPGVFDLIGNEFLGNAGSGEFIPGPEILEDVSNQDKDPYTWYESDSPTLPQLTQYLVNVHALRSAIANQSPEVPGVKDMFSVEAANNIEKILLSIQYAIQIMKQTYVPCGATACGGDYL